MLVRLDRPARRTVAALWIAVTVGAGCSAATSSEHDQVGQAELAIKRVPEDVHCVSVSAVGARSVLRDFDVAPGNDARLSMVGLPLGEVEFTARAYRVCRTLQRADDGERRGMVQ